MAIDLMEAFEAVKVTHEPQGWVATKRSDGFWELESKHAPDAYLFRTREDAEAMGRALHRAWEATQ